MTKLPPLVSQMTDEQFQQYLKLRRENLALWEGLNALTVALQDEPVTQNFV